MRQNFTLTRYLSDIIIGKKPGFPRLYDTGSLSNGIRCMIDITPKQGIRVIFDTRGRVYRNPDNPNDKRNGKPVDYLIYHAWSRNVAQRFFNLQEVNEELYLALNRHFEEHFRDPLYAVNFIERFSVYTLDDTHGQQFIFSIDKNGVSRSYGY